MKNVLFILLCVHFSVLPIYAEEGKKEKKDVLSFEVLVVDALTEEPIPAAKIKINQKDIEAYTDFDGFTKIDNLAQGVYDIEISFISYQKSRFRNVQVDKSSRKLLVKLRP